jgi:hypothetical protein
VEREAGGHKKLLGHAEWHLERAGGAPSRAGSSADRVARRDARAAARLAGQPIAIAPERAPRLWPENRLAWKVFRVCSSQLIVGGLGVVVGISHAALADAMRWCQVPEEEESDVFEKFCALEALYRDAMNARVSKK